jgi:adenylosuccinate synthase
VNLEIHGWTDSTAVNTDIANLPPAPPTYQRSLEELVGSPLAIVSTGPDRDATMVLRDPFA